MLAYANDKRIFTINEVMAEFKISYMQAVDFIYTYRKTGNIRQLNDFRYHVYRMIPVEEIKVEEEAENKSDKTSADLGDDENMSLDELLEEIDKLLEEEKDNEDSEASDAKKFENTCMDVIMNVIAISPKITRQEAIVKSEEMHSMFKILKNDEMLEVMNRVIEEFKQASDEEFCILRKQFHGNRS